MLNQQQKKGREEEDEAIKATEEREWDPTVIGVSLRKAIHQRGAPIRDDFDGHIFPPIGAVKNFCKRAFTELFHRAERSIGEELEYKFVYSFR